MNARITVPTTKEIRCRGVQGSVSLDAHGFKRVVAYVLMVGSVSDG